MRRFVLPLLASLAAIGGSVAPAASAHSTGTPSQISWVRSAAGRFLGAELQRNAAGVCSILNAPMRKSYRNRSCEQRWNARLAALLRSRSARSELHADNRAVSSATVEVHGSQATIALPHPLLNGSSRFLWTENCWMLEG